MAKRTFSEGRKTLGGTRKSKPPTSTLGGQGATSGKVWILGTLELPEAPGTTETSQLIVWMSETGYVLNAEPCEKLNATVLLQSLAKTVANPQAGSVGMPESIRTSSPKLAGWLRENLGTRVEVVVAPTPEVDGVAQTIHGFAALPEASQGRPSYFTPGVEERHVSRFFACAAGLYRAQPWRIVKSDTDVIAVRAPSLQIENAAAIVIGQNRQCYGILVFSGYESFESYIALAKAHASGSPSVAKVDFVSLNYERAQDLDPALRAEVKRFGWSVAGPSAYPWPIAVGENWATRSVTLDELKLLSALGEALPQFLTETRQFQTSSVTRASFKANYRVLFDAEIVKIDLEFPHPTETGDDAA